LPVARDRRTLRHPEEAALHRIHLDTDIGGDIDDLCALAMVLGWPGVELAAVTTVADDGGRRAGYARYALEVAGRADVPVAAGADVSLGGYRGRPGFPEERAYWPEPVAPLPGPVDEALDLLARSIAGGATIVAVGPYTNLALLEARSPGILAGARLYVMGGYVVPPRQGFPQHGNDDDYNIQVDVASAHRVLAASRPIMVPLTVTVETAVRRSHLGALEGAGPLARLVARQAEAYAVDEDLAGRFGRTCERVPDDITNFLHDPLACAIALGWDEGVELQALPLMLEVRDGFLHERIDEAGRPTRVVTAVDGERFGDLWLAIVAGGTPPTGP